MMRGCSVKPGAAFTNPPELHAAANAVPIAIRGRLGLSQDVQGGEAGGLGGVLDRDVATDLACDRDHAALHGQLAGDVEGCAADDEGHVVGGGRRRFRQHEP